eukprot:TRINITY_DN64862_c0_g1_i1.p1 TRINITY_DN64862_c0_g1~~TRINITY_DN64862_c0_g1_i1.p1  ORF type:complete len:155 (-),score=33.16 TRINITY_DN64862_c0_g1_i1:376-795(-)
MADSLVEPSPGVEVAAAAESVALEPATCSTMWSVEVVVGGYAVEELLVDEATGPQVLQMDGSTTSIKRSYRTLPERSSNSGAGCMGHSGEKTWKDMTSTERQVLIHIAAKSNLRIKERLGLVDEARDNAYMAQVMRIKR